MVTQVFRIYRDVRFSKDPTPYKVRDVFDFIFLSLLVPTATDKVYSQPHFSAAW